ncbi:MAG: DNA primase [Bacteroidaceae bacterium]|nr:DNA primase [Bacteroidaceae bacterium]
MIDRSTIERIIDAAKVEEVVSDFVALRKRSINLLGLCPFHDEKTPSFIVSPAKNIWKCFGCGKGGNPVHFIMEHEQLSYYEALKWLARKYNIEVKERELTNEEKERESLRESLFVINQHAHKYFVDNLHKSDEGINIALSYFRHRGINEETIVKFELGYSPERRDAYAKKAAADGFNPKLVDKTGLCFTTEDGRQLDRFWGRVMFPVHTVSGKVVAFGGRVMQNNPKVGKYTNSPESEIYHKSDHLYGIYFAKQAIIQKDFCIMVEGYLDVISLHQAGIKNVVASSGTSLTIEQIRLVHRFTNNMLLLYDGDKAGIKASLRGIDMLLREGLNIKVALLPDGEDPDSYAQKHSTEEVEQFLKENQVDFITFKTNLLLDEAGNDPIRRSGLIADVVKSISVIPNDILRSEYTKKCSEILQAKEQVLVSEIAKLRRQSAQEQYGKQANGEETDETPAQENIAAAFIGENNTIYNKERAIIQFILRNGEKPLLVPEDPASGTPSFTESVISNMNYSIAGDGIEFSHPLYKKIFEEAAKEAEKPDFIAEKHFLAHPDAEISRLTAELCNDRYMLSKFFQEKADEEERNETAILFEHATRLAISYKLSLVDEMLKETMKKLKEPATMQSTELAQEIMQNYKFLKETQQALNNQLRDYGFGECALNV